MRQQSNVGVPVALAVSVCICSLTMGSLIRQYVGTGRSFWIVDSLLYIAHTEHGTAVPAWGIAALVVSLTAGALLLVTIHRTGRSYAGVPEILLAMVLGGSLANILELVMRGSVTDFFGIHFRGGGVYSSGDIAIGIGGAFLPIAA